MISEICRKNLQTVVSTYRKSTGRSIKQISVEFYGNQSKLPAFLDKRSGESMSLKKFDEVLRLFQDRWPEGADWPMLRSIFFPAKPRKISVNGGAK